MRILTVRQPWAWAIIYGGKDVENRVLNIAGDYRGPVAIHVAQTYDTAWSSPPMFEAMKASGAHSRPGEYPWHEDHGAIIGVVDLADVHTSDTCRKGPSWQESPGLHELPYDGCSPWAENGAHHLVLRLALPLAEPIPYRGALGLRRLDDATATRVIESALTQIGRTR